MYLLDRVGSLSGVEIKILADIFTSDAAAGCVESLLSVANRAGIVDRSVQNSADAQAHMRGRPFFSEAQVKGRARRRLERDPILNLVGMQFHAQELNYRPPVQAPQSLDERWFADLHLELSEGAEHALLLALRGLCNVSLATKKVVTQNGDFEQYYFPLQHGSSHVGAINSQFMHMDWGHHRNPLIVVKKDGLDLYERPTPKRRWPWSRK